jgi:hypothetical protein
MLIFISSPPAQLQKHPLGTTIQTKSELFGTTKCYDFDLERGFRVVHVMEAKARDTTSATTAEFYYRLM